jgi:hypothetical protein
MFARGDTCYGESMLLEAATMTAADRPGSSNQCDMKQSWGHRTCVFVPAKLVRMMMCQAGWHKTLRPCDANTERLVRRIFLCPSGVEANTRRCGV